MSPSMLNVGKCPGVKFAQQKGNAEMNTENETKNRLYIWSLIHH